MEVLEREVGSWRNGWEMECTLHKVIGTRIWAMRLKLIRS